jgi:ferredoxin
MYRSKKLLEACRKLPCQLCQTEDGTVIAAHSNQLLDGKGKGIKASDYRIAALCFTCHMDIDQGNKLSKEQRREFWEISHRKTIGELFERGLIVCP